ncbi:MAG: hypothetical protein ACR2K4_01595 [Candidatus Limnocylindria bacterium]
MILGAGMLLTGVVAIALAIVTGDASPGATGTLGLVAALGLGVGVAWMARVVRPGGSQAPGELLVRLLTPTFDDAYILVLGPRLPIRDSMRLDGLLIGPAGVRSLTVRDWEGRYRVRGRSWEFDAGRRRGWIPCRTNPSFEAASLAEGVTRWATGVGLANLPVKGTLAFPLSRSRIVLEEPADEIVTIDNGPWWANAIGRTRHLDEAAAARLLTAVLDAADAEAHSQRGWPTIQRSV